MSKNYGKFRSILHEMFQLDQADLDFGIYRIMNQKRDEIVRFLDEDLAPQVRQSLEEYAGTENVGLKQELSEVIKQAQEIGADPDSLPKVQELRKKIEGSVDLNALEQEVFSALTNFFRRYYQDGDFISQRRYKEGVYAIPYEGEEVKLHWANSDQYYIKTSENFRDFAFKLPNGKRVHFKLVDADTETDNRKAQEGKERRFILVQDEPLLVQDDELIIRFEYRGDGSKKKQKDFNASAVEEVLADDRVAREWIELGSILPTEKNPNRTLLEKRLTEYTARNTFDYFIHKDLEGFLRRELDFYIKNEIMHLDDIEAAAAPKVEQYLAKIKAIRRIAHKIIRFLAQIEDFQKKLWLKKKFVIESDYCITLDRIPEELYPDIAANDAQREEWVRLFAIDNIEGAEGDLATEPSPGYSVPLSVDFLKSHPSLVLDSRHFDESVCQRLLSSIPDITAALSGLVVTGDNYQALRLLTPSLKNSIRCIYTDPPYNTGKGDFAYKDQFQHSSWASMLTDRLRVARHCLADSGVVFISVSDIELSLLIDICDAEFGRSNRIATIVWKGATDNNPTRVAVEHEYILCYANHLSANDAIWKSRTSESKELMLSEYERLRDSQEVSATIQKRFRKFIKEALHENQWVCGDAFSEGWGPSLKCNLRIWSAFWLALSA